MYKLYGHNGSGSAAIEMALIAVGEKFELIDVASWEPETPIHELTKVNPLSQIPTIILPGGQILTESAAILIYLGDKYPSSGILAQESHQRIKAIQGLIYLAANCYPAVGIIDFPERWTSGASSSEYENIKSGTRQRLYYLWDIFADTFVGTPYLNGPRPGILDFYTVNICRMFSAHKHLEKSRPEFFHLLSTVEHDPSISDVISRHWPE